MAGFGSLAPGEDWQDREARENLAAIEAAKPKPGTWFESIRSALAAPGRIVGSLATTPVEGADAGAMMPETTINPLVKGALDAAGHAVASGATAPGDALAGKIPAFDASGHTSPEMIARGFDTAALAGGTSAASALEKVAPEAVGADVRILGQRLPWGQALASDAAKPGAALSAAEHAPTFNLSAEEALANTARKSGTGAQWSNELKRYGAKPEELDWRGATDMLTKNANVPLPRAAIEGHLAGNKVDLKPVEYKQMPESWKDLTPEQQYAVADKYEAITGQPADHMSPDWYEEIADHSRKGRETGIDSVFNPPRYSEYQLPGGENYRERLLTLPTPNDRYIAATDAMRAKYGDIPLGQMPMTDAERVAIDRHINDYGDTGGAYKSSHWDEPNVIVHRRTTDRTFPEPLTAEEQAAADMRRAAQGQLNGVRQQQHIIARQIQDQSAELERVRRDQLSADYNAGRISRADFRRGFDEIASPAELRPLQDKLQELRAQEDAIRKGMPPEPQPKTSKSVHAEEIQSDWHQAGQNVGYRGDEPLPPSPRNFTEFLAERGVNDPAVVKRLWEDRSSPEGVKLHNAHVDEIDARNNARAAAQKAVPDAPFKDSWHRLALNDLIREAAEKGADEISWTAGRSQPTNPKNLGHGNAADAEKAEKGLIKFYDDTLVNAANKIGKQHGVSVEKGTIPLGEFSHENGVRQLRRAGISNEEWRNMEPEARQALIDKWQGEGHDIFRMKVPQPLKDQALKKGFSMFEDAGPAAALTDIAAHVPAPATKPVPANPDWVAALKGATFDPGAPAIKKTNLVDERGLPVQGAAYTKEARSVLDDIAKGPKGAGPMDLSTQGRVPDVPQKPLPRDLTGLGTVGTHTFPELMNERILFTSRMRGESPQKTLSDFIRGKKPLLNDASFGSLVPRGNQDQR